MCKKCDHLDQKIKYYAQRLSRVTDHEVKAVLDGIIRKFQNEKISLHRCIQDADWMNVFAVDQIADQRLAIHAVRVGFAPRTSEAAAEIVQYHLVVHHSDFDVLIPSHSRIGKLSGGTVISMLLGTPG